MSRPVYAIFVAGGSGTRMGSGIPKQFMDIGGVCILQRSIEAFVLAKPDIRIITVLPRAHFSTWKEICLTRGFDCTQQLVEGGITRFHSVRNALEMVPDGAIVMVHDGVRPLIRPAMISDMLARMDNCRALIPALPVTDTLRYTEAGIPSPDRSRIVAVQTPQVFLSEELKAAYSQPFDTSFTDDGSVAERAGIPITIFPGDRLNIKITTPSDLTLAEAILSVRG